jgi:hypothetical protein
MNCILCGKELETIEKVNPEERLASLIEYLLPMKNYAKIAMKLLTKLLVKKFIT